MLVPCCQAEVAGGAEQSSRRYGPIAELWRHPIHAREFGSHVTNVLRCLQARGPRLRGDGTELVGWEHR